MNPEQVHTVQETWRAVLPIADKAADLFYDRLFVLDPGMRPLFPADLGEQKKKLLAMLGHAVGALRNPETVVPALHQLGRRHVAYGTKSTDYATVGAALLWTLEQGLGAAWTPSVKESWVAAYTLLSGKMIEGSNALA